MRSRMGPAVERARHLAEAAADEHEPAHVLGVGPIVLEQHLAAHRVPDENRGRIAHELAHLHQVVGVCGDVDAVGIASAARSARGRGSASG